VQILGLREAVLGERQGRDGGCPSQRSSSYRLAIRSKNMEQRIAHRVMIRVQPERQEKYGGDETAGTRVFGRTDQDNGTGFTAKPDSGYGVFRDGEGHLEADTNGAKGGCAGDQPDRCGWDETYEARVVDSCRSDFRNDSGSHGSDTHVRAGQKRRGEAILEVIPENLIARCGPPAEDVTKEMYPMVLRTMSYQRGGNEKIVFEFSRTAEAKSDWVFLSMKDQSGTRSYETPEAKIAALACLDLIK
jgi:hypothetical protein